MVKPFALEELLARLRALLRRIQAGRPPRCSRSATSTWTPGPREVTPRRHRHRPHQDRVRPARAADEQRRHRARPATPSTSGSGATTSRPAPTRSTSTSATCAARPRRTASPASSTPCAASATWCGRRDGRHAARGVMKLRTRFALHRGGGGGGRRRAGVVGVYLAARPRAARPGRRQPDGAGRSGPDPHQPRRAVRPAVRRPALRAAHRLRRRLLPVRQHRPAASSSVPGPGGIARRSTRWTSEVAAGPGAGPAA